MCFSISTRCPTNAPHGPTVLVLMLFVEFECTGATGLRFVRITRYSVAHMQLASKWAEQRVRLVQVCHPHMGWRRQHRSCFMRATCTSAGIVGYAHPIAAATTARFYPFVSPWPVVIISLYPWLHRSSTTTIHQQLCLVSSVVCFA